MQRNSAQHRRRKKSAGADERSPTDGARNQTETGKENMTKGHTYFSAMAYTLA